MIFCGLKGVGKTCLLYSMKLGRQAKDWHETNAYNYEVVPYTSRSKVSYKFHCWDLAGKEELRPLWKCFYNHTAVHFLLFVIDASDRKRCTDMGACVRARCQPLLRLSYAHVLLTPPPSISLSLPSLLSNSPPHLPVAHQRDEAATGADHRRREPPRCDAPLDGHDDAPGRDSRRTSD